MKQQTVKKLLAFVIISTVMGFYINASQSEINALVDEAEEIEELMDDPEMNAAAQKILMQHKVQIDNLIAAKIEAKNCEELRRIDRSLRDGLYNLYPLGHKAGAALTYCNVSTNSTSSSTVDFLSTSCSIQQAVCRTHPDRAGKFFDRYDGADHNAKKCLERAQEFYDYCGNKPGELTYATFLEAGVKTASARAGAKNCDAPFGGDLKDGKKIKAYKAIRSSYGGKCEFQTRTCSNGDLSGSYKYQHCTEMRQSSR